MTTVSPLNPGDKVAISSGAVSVSCGLSHACALLNDGTMRCWGDDTYGQIGDNDTAIKPSPVPPTW